MIHRGRRTVFNGRSGINEKENINSKRKNNGFQGGTTKSNLPVHAVKDKILYALENHDIVILLGETGCGKTTQIPQFCYERNLNKSLCIAITQPRRVGAISLSQAVALDMNSYVGNVVGYTIRFEDVTSVNTKIKFLTDGMLLRESIVDKSLMSYGIIILDEVHERTINTDVLIGVVQTAHAFRLKKGLTPLKIILMSATMDVNIFCNYFKSAPAFFMEGRQFNVNVNYAVSPQEDYFFSCIHTIFQIHKDAPANHDILVFLTGQEEIEDMAAKLRREVAVPENNTTDIAMNVLVLYSALLQRHQMDVFRPSGPNTRKVILATNIAETSITIPGIKYVIDSGMVKQRTYNPKAGLDSLQVQRISQAQAWQRTGRAGRDDDGVCFRVYTEDEYGKMCKDTVPEMKRSSLANVALQLSAMGINIRLFKFVEPPGEAYITSALEELVSLGAIQAVSTPLLTEAGKKMAKFPIHPRFSKMLLAAEKQGCVDEILAIISLFSSDSVFINSRSNEKEAVRAMRAKFISSCGDHITVLNIYKNYKLAQRNIDWCHQNYLNNRSLAHASKIHKQLTQICSQVGIVVSNCGYDSVKIRKCLLSGLFMNVAKLTKDKRYLLSNKDAVSIHPSSVLFNTLPHYILFTEVILTNKCYVRDLSIFDEDWLSEIESYSCKRFNGKS